jgi:hypothetical protein
MHHISVNKVDTFQSQGAPIHRKEDEEERRIRSHDFKEVT